MRIFITIFGFSFIGLWSIACNTAALPTSFKPEQPALIAESFDYPLGDGRSLTELKDTKDDWYNALDLGEENHLGEDWNKNSGGNTDCGEPVYSIGNGVITYAADAGPGWGNVVIVTHLLPDGSKVQSLYGHLQEILKSEGEVKLREQVGKIGNANGRYLCHLHLELREQSSREWDRTGGGYSPDRTGWLDPSEFIDQRKTPVR